MKWQASAPSNIALIKYMGKNSIAHNLPANASLSYTLGHLRSFVELELAENLMDDRWEPLTNIPNTFALPLNATAQQRYINHLSLIKERFGFTDNFIIRSVNNFPAGCGIASSAASFAALTVCAVNALTELTQQTPLTLLEIANLSRQGSGSSCRSLFGPWVVWQDETIENVKLPYQQLIHQVIVVSEQHKMVSSSEAHQRVASSLLYANRNERAQQRLEELITALQQQDWQTAYAITWQEFWDMHALFETAQQPFGYMQSDTLAVLNYLRTQWEKTGDGPLVTLDAGPNVHVLLRPDQMELATIIKRELAEKFMVL